MCRKLLFLSVVTLYTVITRAQHPANGVYY